MKKGIFITGTDTNVGKTWVGTQLAGQLYQQGIAVAPRKPIESGCEVIEGELQPHDASLYWHALKQSQSLDSICPLRLKAALSPVRAAELEDRHITTADVVAACQVREQFLLAEGAGGFYSPLTADGLNADLAEQLKLPVLIVAADRLGCLNHCLLTIDAIKQRGLRVVAVVMNQLEETEEHQHGMDNAAELRSRIGEPVIHTGDGDWLGQLGTLVLKLHAGQ